MNFTPQQGKNIPQTFLPKSNGLKVENKQEKWFLDMQMLRYIAGLGQSWTEVTKALSKQKLKAIIALTDFSTMLPPIYLLLKWCSYKKFHVKKGKNRNGKTLCSKTPVPNRPVTVHACVCRLKMF